MKGIIIHLLLSRMLEAVYQAVRFIIVGIIIVM